MAFPVLNAAKPLSSVKSCGSELHRLIIHCVKIVSPFISLKCIAFRSVCPLCSYIIGQSMWGNDLLLPFQVFRTWFSHHFYPSFSMSPCLNLSLSPFRRSHSLLLIVFLLALFLLWHSEDWAVIVKPRRWNSPCPRLQPCRVRQGCTEMTKWWMGKGHFKLKIKIKINPIFYESRHCADIGGTQSGWHWPYGHLLRCHI